MATELFSDEFENIWAEADSRFRDNLLKAARGLGSLHRTTLSRSELQKAFGPLFYEALEEALDNETRVKLEKCLLIPMPNTFDELLVIFQERDAAPFQAFVLLLLFIHARPLRAFFSGRDEPLPYNTLRVRIYQRPSEALPRKASYALSQVDLSRCYDGSPSGARSEAVAMAIGAHSDNHFFWENEDDEWGAYTWHF
jgi:hypothetical protein